MGDYGKLNRKGKVCCPNHGEPLEGIGFPIPNKGTGMCPVSGCSFDFEIETDAVEQKVDKFGNVTKSKRWNVTGEENN